MIPRPTPPGGSTSSKARLFEAHLGSGRDQRPRAWPDGERAGAHRCRAPADRQPKTAFMSAIIADGAHDALSVRWRRTIPPTRSNDARVHPSGTFWIGTMGRNAEKGAGAIYAFHRRRDLAALPGDHHPECDLLFARWCDRLFHRHRAKPCSIACRSIRRRACRAASPRRCCDHRGVGGLDGAVSMPTG